MKNIDGIILSEERHNQLLNYEKIVQEEKTIVINFAEGNLIYKTIDTNRFDNIIEFDWLAYKYIENVTFPENNSENELLTNLENSINGYIEASTNNRNTIKELTKANNKLTDKIYKLNDLLADKQEIINKKETKKESSWSILHIVNLVLFICVVIMGILVLFK
jgi:hypothetical protein